MRELISPSAGKAALLIVKSSASGAKPPDPHQSSTPRPTGGRKSPKPPRIATPEKFPGYAIDRPDRKREEFL
jgi:hypothetical protein